MAITQREYRSKLVDGVSRHPQHFRQGMTNDELSGLVRHAFPTALFRSTPGVNFATRRLFILITEPV